MIDWGGGFFLGLKLGFILIVLAIEFYFIALDKYTEGDISKTEFNVLSGITGLCIIISAVQLKKFSVGLWLIIPVPLFYFIFSFFEHSLEEKENERSTVKRVRILEDKIGRNSKSSNSYSMLGDIYFKKGDYGKALEYYRKAFSIRETSELGHKIKIAGKEDRIQRGEIWVCRECGADNPGKSEKCISCGSIKSPAASIKKDILASRAEIKKWVVCGFGIPFAVIAVILVLKAALPSIFYDFFAVAAGLFVIYFLLKKFFTW
jgi:tetratricopeptide (TPR) repeat protein